MAPARKSSGKKTFVEITNGEIYQQQQDHQKRVMRLEEKVDLTNEVLKNIEYTLNQSVKLNDECHKELTGRVSKIEGWQQRMMGIFTVVGVIAGVLGSAVVSWVKEQL